MTKLAIRNIVNRTGFFLMLYPYIRTGIAIDENLTTVWFQMEGVRIDHALHHTRAKRTLDTP